MSLEAKTQKIKNDWLFMRMNSSKSCMRDFFTDSSASSKVRLFYLEVLKNQKSYGNIFRGFKAPTKLWLMFLEGK